MTNELWAIRLANKTQEASSHIACRAAPKAGGI